MKELFSVLIFGRLGMKEGAAQGADPVPSRDEGKELSVVQIQDPAGMKERAVRGADHRPCRGEGQSCPWC